MLVRAWPLTASLLLFSTSTVAACGGDKSAADGVATQADGAKTGTEDADKPASESPGEDTKAEEKAASAGPATGAGETGAAAEGAAAEGAAAEGAAAEGAPSEGAADSTGGEAAPTPEEQIKALMEEAANKKTKDDRVFAALEEAKALGAKPKDLAKAANKRGEKAITDPERATKFFEWAAAADPKYPNATFNLAKLAANTGDIALVKELLTEVKKRRGKKLLQTVEFDPSFALVADDPEVTALLK